MIDKVKGLYYTVLDTLKDKYNSIPNLYKIAFLLAVINNIWVNL